MLAELCGRVRPELACLGELGAPLIDALGVVERADDGRDVGALSDPSFALDVLAAGGPGGDPAVVGRVLDFLRTRADAGTTTGGAAARAGRWEPVTVAEAVRSYEAGSLALMAPGTQRLYGAWVRRLATAYGDRDPDDVTAGDLQDLVAAQILKSRTGRERHNRSGRCAEENAVSAFRSLWSYLVAKRWARENVAQQLRKPGRSEPNRRPWRPEEAALVRHLVRGLGRDPLLNEVTITLAERIGLRHIELGRLRVCDIDMDRAEVEVWGKLDKPRHMPLPPGLAGLLARYIESRRPAHIPPDVWARSDTPLLRHPPNDRSPEGRPVGRRRTHRLFTALHEAAPDLFADGDLVLHCYRHALGTFVEAATGGR